MEPLTITITILNSEDLVRDAQERPDEDVVYKMSMEFPAAIGPDGAMYILRQLVQQHEELGLDVED